MGMGWRKGSTFTLTVNISFPFFKKFNDCTFIINYFLVLSLHLIFNKKKLMCMCLFECQLVHG